MFNNLLDLFDLRKTYIFNWLAETGFALGGAAAMAVYQVMSDYDDAVLSGEMSWEAWAMILLAALWRVAQATLSNALPALWNTLFGPAEPPAPEPPPPPEPPAPPAPSTGSGTRP